MERGQKSFAAGAAAGMIASVLELRALTGESYNVIIKPYMLAAILTAVICMIATMQKVPLFEKGRRRRVFTGAYIVSLFMLLLSAVADIGMVWSLGSVLMAVFFHPFLGISFQLVFTYLFCSILRLELENFLYHFLIGTLLCFFVPYIKNKKTFLYIGAITLSGHLMLLFVLKNFLYKDVMTKSVFWALITNFLVTLLTLAVRMLLARKGIYPFSFHQASPLPYQIEKERKNQRLDEEARKKTKGTGLEACMSQNASLLENFKRNHLKTYRHYLLISLLSERAAGLIGADRMLAKCGGMYLGIGLLGEKKTKGVSAGEFLERQGLPLQVCALVKQQQEKKPLSRESAIVFLTEAVTNRVGQARSIDKFMNTDLVIGQLMGGLLSDGCLDGAGISLEDFKKLQKFYKDNMKKEEARQ